MVPAGRFSRRVLLRCGGLPWPKRKNGLSPHLVTGRLKISRRNLLDSGFEVEQVLDEIGIITGAASDDVVKRLRSVPGVADISPEPSVDIGPPDSPVTW